MTPRKLLTIAVFLSALGVGYYSMNAAPVTSDESYTYQGGLQWYEDPDEAMAVAAEEDKPVLVYYWATWCTYCEEYDTEHYRDRTVREELDEYVLLAINIDEPGPGADMLSEHGASYPPQHVVVTPEGETRAELGGYLERDQFRQWLQSAREGSNAR